MESEMNYRYGEGYARMMGSLSCLWRNRDLSIGFKVGALEGRKSRNRKNHDAKNSLNISKLIFNFYLILR